MATIIEGALWTLTDEAAQILVEQDIIKACDADHDLLDVDQPIYHLANGLDPKAYFCLLDGFILAAEKKADATPSCP